MKNFIIGFQFLLIGALGSLSGLQLFEYKELAEDYAKFVWVQTGDWEREDEAKTQAYLVAKHIQKKNRHVPSIIAEQWAETILQASELYNLNVNVMLALFQIESATVHYSREGFITISNKGAGGLGQVMPFWYRECPHSSRPQDLKNGSVNIMCSAFILRHYLDQTNNDIELGLTAYNAGYRGVRLYKQGRDITNGYAKNILSRI